MNSPGMEGGGVKCFIFNRFGILAALLAFMLSVAQYYQPTYRKKRIYWTFTINYYIDDCLNFGYTETEFIKFRIALLLFCNFCCVFVLQINQNYMHISSNCAIYYNIIIFTFKFNFLFHLISYYYIRKVIQ